jgi:uncharacterized membrane protein YuzA (DUF378 family)
MKLREKIKTALDETRILILGAQILLGFQFRGVFQDGFEALPAHARYLDGVALVVMLVVVALLIAPALYHRIIAGGEDSGDIHRVISWMASAALLPFAVSLGLSLFIGIERIFGLWAGIAAGAGFGGLAVFAWYAWELIRKTSTGHKERQMAAMQNEDGEKTPLHNKIEQMLTEARVILPGAQALLGFQLAIIITQSFEKLPRHSQVLHALSLGLIALAVILLMAPAAYHRIVYAGEDSAEFHKTGSLMVTAATVPLALGISADAFVVIAKIAGTAAGVSVAVLALAGFVGLWHVYPLLRRAAMAQSTRRAPAE